MLTLSHRFSSAEWYWCHLGFLTAAFLLVGCGSGDKAKDMFDSVNGSNVQRLANLYCVFQAQNNFKGPKDEPQFRDFIVNMPPQRLKYYGVDAGKIDELFISERDKQPFKIRWELQAKPRQGPVPLVFEQQGVNGKMMIGFSGFEVRDVEQFELDQYWSGKRDEETQESNRGNPGAS